MSTIAIAGAAAAAAAAAAVLDAFTSSSKDAETKSGCGPNSMVHQKAQLTVIITVNATPRRTGGIIRISHVPHRYFYSADWSNTFRFPQEADKFEMVNALIALDIIETLYLIKFDRVILQTDNNFALKANGLECKHDHES